MVGTARLELAVARLSVVCIHLCATLLDFWWRIWDLNPSDVLCAKQMTTPSSPISHLWWFRLELNQYCRGLRPRALPIELRNRGAEHRIRTCKRLPAQSFQDSFLTTRTFGVFWRCIGESNPRIQLGRLTF